MQITYQLSDADWAKLIEVNRLLTEITARHGLWCECHLCRARCDTDTQDAESRVVRCTPVVD